MMMLIKLLSCTVFILEYFLWTEAQLCSEGEIINNQTNCCKGYSLKEGKCIACSSFKYGENCSTTCTCVQANSESCNNVDGTCMCKPGFTGSNCGSECASWTFGDGCKQCTCVRAKTIACDFVSGVCTCLAGYKGKNCEESCDDNTFGIKCAGSCTCNAANSASPCGKVNGTCNCKPGYDPHQNCGKECRLPHYGDSCLFPCKCNTQTASSCNAFTGECVCRPGYVPPSCRDVCSGYTYGQNCSTNCTCVPENTHRCDPVTGGCACLAGWQGQNCQSVNNFGGTCYYQLPGFLFHIGIHFVFGIITLFAITNYHDNHSHHGIQFTLEQCQHVTYYRQLPGQFPSWTSFCAQFVIH